MRHLNTFLFNSAQTSHWLWNAPAIGVVRGCSGCTCTLRAEKKKFRRILRGKFVSAPIAHQVQSQVEQESIRTFLLCADRVSISIIRPTFEGKKCTQTKSWLRLWRQQANSRRRTTNCWMNEWMNEWVNEWMNEWMNELINALTVTVNGGGGGCGLVMWILWHQRPIRYKITVATTTSLEFGNLATSPITSKFQLQYSAERQNTEYPQTISYIPSPDCQTSSRQWRRFVANPINEKITWKHDSADLIFIIFL